jgi:hypothetical protein
VTTEFRKTFKARTLNELKNAFNLFFDKFFIYYGAKERVVKLRLLSSRYGITKIIVALLIVVFALTAVVISYYAATRLLSQNSSPTPTPSPEPTVSPTPISSFPITQTPTTKPTPIVAASPTITPFPTEIATQEKIRDSAMSFIKSNHPETAVFVKDLVWTGGRETPSKTVGAETYMYYSNGWNVTINYPVVPNSIYSIVADYSAPSTGIPYRIIWVGTSQNEVIKETSYVFAQ